MALDYILNNTGPEVQERLDRVPVTQAQLTDEIADREAADAAETQAREASDAALQDSIGAEATRAEGAEQSLDGRITDVEGKIPQGATPQNPLADKEWVTGSIATATADFITASVNDLVNYYLKSETYTREEVQQIIGSIKQFSYQSVPELPAASASTKGIIYLVPSADPQSENVKDEYITVYRTNEMGVTYYDWEQIGSTAIDLADYYTKSQTDAAITADLNTALASYSTTSQMNTAIETAIANLDLSDTYETKGAAAAVVGDAGADYNTLAKIQGKLEPIEGEVGDKVYEAGSGKGLGRKNLPMNSIGNKNLLSQSMINQANTVYVIQNDYEIGSDGSVDLRVDPISVTIGGVNYYCKEVSLNAGETVLLTATGSAKIIVNDGGSWVLYQYNYYTAQSNTTIRLGAVPTSQTSVINYIKTGGSITIPANCTLKFEGGSISNGTIVFNGTYIDAPCRAIFHNVTIPKNESGHALTTQENTYLDWFDQGSNGAHYAYLYALQVGSKVVCTAGKEYVFNKNHTLFQSVSHDAEIVGNGAVFRFTSTFADNSDYPDVLYHQRAIYMHDLTVYYHTPTHSFINSQGNQSWSNSRFCSGWKTNPNNSARLENITIYVEPETPTAEFNSAFNTLYETYCGKDFVLRNCNLYFSQSNSDISVGGNTFAWFMFIKCPEEVNILIDNCYFKAGGRDEGICFNRSRGIETVGYDVTVNATIQNSHLEKISAYEGDAAVLMAGDNVSGIHSEYDFTVNINVDNCSFYRGAGDPNLISVGVKDENPINLHISSSSFLYDGQSDWDEHSQQYPNMSRGIINLVSSNGFSGYDWEFDNCTFTAKYLYGNMSGIWPVKFVNCTFNIDDFVRAVQHGAIEQTFGYIEFVNSTINLIKGDSQIDSPRVRLINCDINTADGTMFSLKNYASVIMLTDGVKVNGLPIPNIDKYHVLGSYGYSYKYSPITPVTQYNLSLKWLNDTGSAATVHIGDSSYQVPAGDLLTDNGVPVMIKTVVNRERVPIIISTANGTVTRNIYCGSLHDYNEEINEYSTDGDETDVPTFGAYADKPSGEGLEIGFRYFCTDLKKDILLESRYMPMPSQRVDISMSSAVDYEVRSLDIYGPTMSRYRVLFQGRNHTKLYACKTNDFSVVDAPGADAILLADNGISETEAPATQVSVEKFFTYPDREEYPYVCHIRYTNRGVYNDEAILYFAKDSWVEYDGLTASTNIAGDRFIASFGATELTKTNPQPTTAVLKALYDALRAGKDCYIPDLNPVSGGEPAVFGYVKLTYDEGGADFVRFLFNYKGGQALGDITYASQSDTYTYTWNQLIAYSHGVTGGINVINASETAPGDGKVLTIKSDGASTPTYRVEWDNA